MNIHLGDVVLILIAVVLIIIGYMAWRIGQRLRVTLERLNGALEILVPRVDRLLAQAEEELAAVHGIVKRANRIAARADEVTGEARNLGMELLDYVGKVVHTLRYVEAGLVGLGVGIKSFRAYRRHKRESDSPEDELGYERRA